MQPRIYLYKVTFEEVPHWYWGIHKEKRFDDGYMGSPSTHKHFWDWYTPVLEVKQEFEYSEKGWSEAQAIEERVILPDLNNSLCLNESAGIKRSLKVCQEAGRKGGKIACEKLTFEQRSKGGTECFKKNGVGGRLLTPELGRELGRQGAEKVNRQRREEGTLEKYCSIAGKVGGKVTSSQRWMCTITGHVSNAAALARWQKARGIDTRNRVKLS